MNKVMRMSLVSLLLAGAAHAQMSDDAGVYVNVGVTQLSADVDLSQIDVAGQPVDLGTQSPDITMITGRIGYRLNDYISFEGELGFGLSGDDFNQDVPVTTGLGTVNVDTDVGLDIDNYFAGFVKGTLPISEQFEAFARGGYGSAEAEADITASALGFSAAASESQSFDGFAFGVGGQFNFNEMNGIRLDYSSIGGDADIISLSYARRF